jgi:hypothetical protein
MKYILEPEVAGGLGKETQLDSSTHPPQVHRLHYEFEFGHDSNDLVESFPCFIVSNELAQLFEIENLTGYSLDEVLISSNQCDSPAKKYNWLKISNSPENDLFIAKDHRLAVSEKAYKVIFSKNMSRCDVEKCA